MTDDGPTDPPGDEALLRAYEPVVRFTEGELFLPTAVGPVVQRCSLWGRDPDGADEDVELLVPAGRLTLDELARAGRQHRDRALQLRFVVAPLRRRELREWRRQDRPRLQSSGRLAAVGVLTRSIDSLLRLSLLLRGRVPGGMAAAAEVATREHLVVDRCAYHGRVVRDGGFTVLQYWLFYVLNDWRSTFAGVNDHEGDWEVVMVYLADADPGAGADGGGPPVPRWVAASSHDHGGDELRRRWDDPALLLEGDHPVVFAGAGSHAHTFGPGDVIVAVDVPGLRRVINFVARTWKRLAPWSRWTPSADAFALPFLDYARGDGPVVGPGHPTDWDAVVIDDDVAWVREYRGLWGLDTEDVFGGERAPAGPRYERDGTVRGSWADPLGWAGLQKVAPSEAAAAATLADHVRALDARLEDLDASIAAERAGLRLLSAQIRSLGGTSDLRQQRAEQRAELLRRETGLAATAAERTRIAEEAGAYRDHLGHPPPPDPPDAHLKPRRTAPAADRVVRPRLLRVWGTVSTPLLVLTIVILLTAPPWAFLTSLAVFFALFLGVEAAARGRLLAFLVGLILTAATVAVAVGLVVGLLANWRIVLAVLLSLAALVLLVFNVLESRRS